MQQRSLRAFTLIELVVVITTIGILTLLSTPGVRQATNRARATTTANDLRIFTDAIEFYSTAQGSYPSSMSYSHLPSDIEGYLPIAWSDGSYSWFYIDTSDYTYIYVYNLKFTAEQALQIDTIIDDGNIATGNLRIAVNGTGLLYLFRMA